MHAKILLVIAFVCLMLQLSLVTHAEGRTEHRAAPPFTAHPPGEHPRGAIMHSHPLRVLATRVVKYGHAEWPRWDHPEFVRPLYYWSWPSVQRVTCTAEDSYGDQYPVSEATFRGFAASSMTLVEDDALDRCHAESQDPSCFLTSCGPGL